MAQFTRVFRATITTDGRLEVEPEQRREWGGFLRRLAGKSVEVVVRPRKSIRSQKQNAWLWGAAYPILAEEFGYDQHEHEILHYALVAKCFGTRMEMGVEVPNARSSKLNTKLFSEYMEWLQRFAAEWEPPIDLPLPDEVDYDDLMRGRTP